MIYGYIPDTIEEDHYVFGSQQLPLENLQPDGQWDAFLPVDEFQMRNGLETSNCTAYGTLNCIETILARKFGLLPNYSERALGIAAGTYPPGNSPHKVAETIRKQPSVVQDALLPFDDSIKSLAQYFSPNPLTKGLLNEGQRWMYNYEFGHEWVLTDYSKDCCDILKEALKYSPLGVAVYAWEEQDGLYVRPKGAKDNHWVMLYGFEEGKYWKVFDQYDSTHKKLDWNFGFSCAKKYHINKRLLNKKPSVFQSLISMLFSIFRRKPTPQHNGI